MSANEQIAKLEALLARVSSRANEPRAARTPAVYAARPAVPAAPPTTPGLPRATPAVPVVSSPRKISIDSTDVEFPPPPAARPVPPPAPPPPVLAVSKPDTERMPDVVEAPPAAQSDARLIAAKEVEPIDLDATSDSGETMMEVRAESIPVEEMSPEPEAAVEDPAPSSSRRPISPPSADEIEQTAFGAEDLAEPPRHTPPPESGRLPAAPDLAPVIDVDDDAQDITGVHHSAAGDRPVARIADEPDALARSGEHEGLSSPPDEVTPPPALVSRVELAPQAVHPKRETSAAIVDTVGQAMAFAPATFGELLDATLGL